MSKTVIKVYFNNGCTTLLYNESTNVEEIIKMVIKGRLSLNELRFKNCFKLRATKYSQITKTSDHLANGSSTNNDIDLNENLVESYWLRNSQKIKEWLDSIDNIEYYRLHLRIRFLPSDLNEVKFKDPITFNYYYEQVKNDFIQTIAPTLKNAELIPAMFDLGCLEIRRTIQSMNSNVSDKKINYDHLEKDFDWKKFFPDSVLNQQKSKNLKKMIIKGVKALENLNETDCMLKYFEKLYILWKYNEETFKCNLGSTWGVPIQVNVCFDNGISGLINNSKAFQNTKFEDISLIITELDVNKHDALLKLKISHAKELVTFKFENTRDAHNMASLIDGYCALINKTNESIWQMKSENSLEDENEHSSLNRTSLNSNTTSNDRELDITDEAIKFKNNKDNSYELRNHKDKSNSPSSLGDTNETDLKSFNSSSIDNIKCKEISRDSLIFQEKLGSGQFGEVFKGIYKKNDSQTIEVAIKKLKINSSNELDEAEQAMIVKKFMKEAKIMQSFDHQHIIKLIGIYYDDSLSIVMELAKFSNLKIYLQTNKEYIETNTLINYCYQLNSAMAYLESKKFVHRDIAARNVLVFNHECVKLADFGLSRETDENVYLASKSKLPIKWMAPESINFRRFTSQSDVWMFGICVWEILTYGCKPFQGIKNPDVIRLIDDNKRLERPNNCPNDLYNLMLKCWEYDSSKRPTFWQLKDELFLITTNYNKEKHNNNKIPLSISNGSSFFSNSSASSTLSSSNNLSPNQNESNIMIPNSIASGMTLIKIPIKNMGSNEQRSPQPPPKPNRSNNTNTLNARSNPKKFEDFSPTRELADKNQLKYQNNYFLTNEFGSNQNDEIGIADKYFIKQAREQFFKSDFNKPYVGTNDSSSNTNSNISFSTLKKENGNSDHKIDEKLKGISLDNSEIDLGANGRGSIERQVDSPILPTSPARSKNQNSPEKKDLLLRDQTLKFIQSISIFIKYLNSDENRKLDNELKAIMVALKSLIQTIESIDVYNESTEINNFVNGLDANLNIMIKDLKRNNLDNVVKSALEMARTANELFLTITKSNSNH